MRTIKFEEKGQDFKEWIIDNGVVVDCQPFQYFAWVGKKVLIAEDCALVFLDGDYTPLNYKIVSNEETNCNYAEGFRDAKDSKKNQPAYDKEEQYRFGYNVAITGLLKRNENGSH